MRGVTTGDLAFLVSPCGSLGSMWFLGVAKDAGPGRAKGPRAWAGQGPGRAKGPRGQGTPKAADSTWFLEDAGRYDRGFGVPCESL